MTTLYEWPPTRSQRAKWTLEELGLDYTSHLVDMPNNEQDSEAYRTIHPLGVVPVLQTEGYLIFESVAIVLQLIDEHPETNLAPAVGTSARAEYYQWCVFACAEIDPAIMTYFDNTLRPLAHMRPPGTPHDAGLAARGHREFADRANVLSNALADRDYLVGSDFTGADIIVGHSCFMATVTGLIDAFPVLKRYHRNLQKRPAYKRAYPD